MHLPLSLQSVKSGPGTLGLYLGPQEATSR